MAMGDASFISRSLFMIGGLLVWAAHFLTIYVFNALACARQFHTVRVLGFGIVSGAIGFATAAAIAAVLVLLILGLRREGPARDTREHKPVDDFLRYTAVTISALSLVAIAWSALPVLFVPPCG